MAVPRFITKTSVLTWSVLLGLVFVVSFAAVVTMGTKASGTFSIVNTRVPSDGRTRQAAPDSPRTLSTAPGGTAQPPESSH